jgi:hypothetical protein
MTSAIVLLIVLLVIALAMLILALLLLLVLRARTECCANYTFLVRKRQTEKDGSEMQIPKVKLSTIDYFIGNDVHIWRQDSHSKHEHVNTIVAPARSSCMS